MLHVYQKKILSWVYKVIGDSEDLTFAKSRFADAKMHTFPLESMFHLGIVKTHQHCSKNQIWKQQKFLCAVFSSVVIKHPREKKQTQPSPQQ